MRRSDPPFTDLIHLRYSSFELKSLEFRAIESRSSGFKFVEFTGLGEIFRTIGRHVERLDAKLVSMSAPDSISDGSIFKIQYETRMGDIAARIWLPTISRYGHAYV